MMKQSILVFLAIVLSCSLFAQEQTYSMFETIYMTPKSSSMKDLETNMGDHNRAFHAELPYRASIWNIINGKNMGKLLWIMGPTTYTQHDNRPSGGAHDDDWQNVSAHLDDTNDGIGAEYWRMDEDLSYFPGNLKLEKQRVWVIDLKTSENYRFEEVIKKVKTVLEKTADPDPMGVYWNTLAGMGNERDVAVVWFFDKWAWMDEDGKFVERYEKEFGNGSWRHFLDEWRDCINSIEVELRVFNKEMSGWDGSYSTE